MVSLEKKISKDIYDRAVANNGHITRDDEKRIFDISELCGYGIYGTSVKQVGDEYICCYSRGSSCD